jgi:hypothetical protein
VEAYVVSLEGEEVGSSVGRSVGEIVGIIVGRLVVGFNVGLILHNRIRNRQCSCQSIRTMES